MQENTYKVIITGSTGMVGKGVLLECLDNPLIKEVLVINRHSIHHNHLKLKEIIVEDFFQLQVLSNKLKEYDCCFFCLGVTSLGMNEQDYKHLSYDLTIQFAKSYYHQNPKGSFIYVSGTGTDSTEKGRSMWARVKGKTENALLNMGFQDAYMFRPGYIQPMRGIRSRTFWYNTLYVIFKPFYFILKRIPGFTTNTRNVGKAMIYVALYGYKNKILHNKEINELANRLCA